MLSTSAAAFSKSSPVTRPFSTRVRGQLHDLGGAFQIVIGDGDLLLHAAQFDVVARHFGEERHENIAALVFAQVDLGVARFDLAADMAPNIDFPGGVEGRLIDADGRHDEGLPIGKGFP